MSGRASQADTVRGVQADRYDPEVAALLIVVGAQLQVSRQILDYLARRGVPTAELAPSCAQLDRLNAALREANSRLLPSEASRPPGGGDLGGNRCAR